MENGGTYTPKSDSLAGRMVAFFRANPEEMLSLDDIVSKFEPTRGNIHTLLSQAATANMVVRDRDESGEYFYKAGKAIGTHAVNGAADSAPPQRTRKTPRAPVSVDLAAVEISTDVPLPAAHGPTRKKLDYQPLLDRMAPGHSAELPSICRSTLAKALKDLHTKETEAGQQVRKFTIRQDAGAETLRVWRIE